MAIKQPSPTQKLMMDYVAAVNGGDVKLANKLVKQLDAMKAADTPVRAAKTARPAKAEGTKPTSKRRVIRKKVVKTTPEKTEVVANPLIKESEASYIAPTRRNSVQTIEQGPVKGMRAQWREVGHKPFVNKFVDPGTDDLPPKHKKIDKKLAKAKRESEPRDEVQKVEAVCYVCNRTVLVFPQELERMSDDERVMRVNRVRCTQCTSSR